MRIPLLQFTTSAQTRKQAAGSLKRVSCFLFQPSAHRAFQIRFLPVFHQHSPSRAGRRASVLGSRQEAAESRCGNDGASVATGITSNDSGTPCTGQSMIKVQVGRHIALSYLYKYAAIHSLQFTRPRKIKLRSGWPLSKPCSLPPSFRCSTFFSSFTQLMHPTRGLSTVTLSPFSGPTQSSTQE